MKGHLFEKEDADFDKDYFDSDFDDENFDDDFDEEDNVHPLKAVGVFLGLVVAAAVICVIAWSISHSESEDEQSAVASEIAQEEDLEASAESVEEPEESEIVDDVEVENEPTSDAVVEVESTENEMTEGEAQETQTAENPVGATDAEPISGNESMEFTEVADTVTAKDVTNLRSVPSTLDAENVVSQLLNGDAISRTGVNDTTGWSRLDYNGQTVYAVTQFLTTDLNYKPPVAPSDPNRITTQDGRVIIFTDCDDYITPKEYVNLRIEPSTSQGETTAKYQISNGTVVHRTGYSPDSGWSRVEYNGEVLYVVSSFVYNTEAVQ